MTSPREQLLATLRNASSQLPEELKPAEAQLKQWETAPEFHATLQDIFLDKSVEQQTRWLAVIYLKNGVDRYWRKSLKDAINPQEKSVIRGRLLSAMDEEVNEIAAQNAVLIAKIARSDFPTEWPDLLENLLTILQSGDALADLSKSRRIQYRCLSVLNLVIKALCSSRLPAGRKMLQQISPQLLQFIANVYTQHVNNVSASVETPLTADKTQQHQSFQLSYTSLKCLRRLLVHGFSDFVQINTAKECYSTIFLHLQKFTTWNADAGRQTWTEASKIDTSLLPILQKHILLIGKLYLDLQTFAMSPYMAAPGTVETLRYYWSVLVNQSGNATAASPPLFEKMLVQGLRLLKGVIRSDYAETSEIALRDSLLTPTFLVSCTEILISRFLILRPSDLESWAADPEGWLIEEEADHWEFELRPCAEKTFMDIFAKHRHLLTPSVLKMLEHVTAQDARDESTVLLRDAVYAAVGLAAHELYESLDFDGWFTNRLISETLVIDHASIPIRRRVPWVVGKWIGVKVSKETRPEVYKLLLQLMSPEEEFIIRLTAVQGLGNCIDDWDFDPEAFAPFLSSVIELLIRLIGEVSQIETSMRILNCISMIIERMGQKITPFAQQITEILPVLWEVSTNEPLFQSSILVTLHKLVTSLKEGSSPLQGLVAPLVQFSVNPSQPAHIYLLEDGLDLWLTTVQNAIVPCSEMLPKLIPEAIKLLEFGTESLKRVLKIIEGSLLLSAEIFAAEYVLPILEAFSRLFSALKPQGVMAMLSVLDTMLQVLPLNIVGDHLMTSGLLGKMFAALEGPETLVIIQCFGIFSRLVLADVGYFLNMVRLASGHFSVPPDTFLGAILDKWIEKFDNMGHPRQRKLNAMGLTTLIPTTDRIIFARVPAIMVILSDVLNEVKETGGGDALVYWPTNGDDDDEGEVEGTPESKRRGELLQRDPIHSTNLLQFIRTKLKQSEDLNGGAVAYQQNVLSTVDPALLDQLSTLLTA